MRESGRPWAMLVTRNFPPLVGGMERVNEHLLAAVEPDCRPALCGPRGSKAFASGDAVVRECRIKPLPFFLVGTTFGAVLLAMKLRPRYVIAGSGLSAPMAWCAARLTGARLVAYLHGLDIIAPSRIYQSLWLPFIRNCDLLLVNSRNTSALAQARGVAAGRIRILHPGVDLPTAVDEGHGDFRARFNLANRPVLLSVGRFTRRKGLAEFVERSLPGIVARQPDVVLVVIGEEASDALHGAGNSERARIETAARHAGVAANLQFVGRCDEATLRAAYRAANCHVFPVLDMPGDVEGFGMVALESAAHGLPTVAFAVGGVPDAVADGVTGALLPAGDYAGFSDATLRLLDQPKSETTDRACREFAADKAWPVFNQRLRDMLRELHA